jgi:hypothetical protein
MPALTEWASGKATRLKPGFTAFHLSASTGAAQPPHSRLLRIPQPMEEPL